MKMPNNSQVKFPEKYLRCSTKIISLAAFWLLSMFLVNPLLSQDLKVLTFNIRFDNPADGINAWPNRVPMVKRYLQEARADIVGVQEALHLQVLDLEKILPDYKRVGSGRDDGHEAGEYSPVFFRKDRFELVDNGQFWLSETPELPGSIGPCAVLPRITTWAQLRIKATGQIIFVFNTHYCHVNDAARWFGAVVMSEKMKEIAGKMPIIVTGDFNLDTDGETYRKVEELFLDNNHLTNAVKLHLTDDQIADGTFNAFRYTENQPFIDYIFISRHFESKSASIDKVISEGLFISDHWPVTLRLKVKPSDKTQD